MTLTNDDLVAIGKVVDERLNKKLVKELTPIKKILNLVKKDLDFVIGRYDTRLNHLEKHTTHPPQTASYS